jgi:hypothetical protein
MGLPNPGLLLIGGDGKWTNTYFLAGLDVSLVALHCSGHAKKTANSEFVAVNRLCRNINQKYILGKTN